MCKFKAKIYYDIWFDKVNPNYPEIRIGSYYKIEIEVLRVYCDNNQSKAVIRRINDRKEVVVAWSDIQFFKHTQCRKKNDTS